MSLKMLCRIGVPLCSLSLFVPLSVAASDGRNPPDSGHSASGSMTFEQLVASVSRPPVQAPAKSEQPLLDYRVTDAAIRARQSAVIEKARQVEPGDSPNGKQSLRVDVARLQHDAHDRKAWNNVLTVAPFDKDDAHFTKIMLAHLYGRFKDQLPPEVSEALRKQAANYTEFLGTGTENHIGMQRVSANIFGAAYPDLAMHDGLSGRALSTAAEEWMQRYGRTVYHSGMKEFLSPIYLGVHNEIWMTGAMYGASEPARRMSQAMLDWIWSDLAVNSNLGGVLPPVTRSKLMLYEGAQRTYPQSHAQWLAWLYWGDTRSRPGVEPLPPEAAKLSPGASIKDMMQDDKGFQTAIVPSSVPFYSDPIIRNIGAKNLALPYMLLQSRPHGEVLGDLAKIKPGKEQKERPDKPASKIKHPEKWESPPPESLRNFLRSVYVARDYSIGAGYVRREESGDNESSMHLLPSAINYRSDDELNTIFVNHPYWYAGQPHGNAGETNEVFGRDCWLGKSPFEQMVHWDNTVIYLYDIPDTDSNAARAVEKAQAKKEKGKDKGKWTSALAEKPLTEACVYVPASIDETRQTPWGWLLREGNVYIALRPFGADRTEWETCKNPVQAGYKRLVLSGSRMGVVVEIGDAEQDGGPDAFAAKVAAAALDTSALASDRTVRYTSSRAIPFSIRFNRDSWFLAATVRGAALDFDRWPICESPYLSSRDGVLDINDGKNGMKIDWSSAMPAYQRYALVARH